MTTANVPTTCPLRYQLWIVLRRLRVGILTTRSAKGLMTSRPLLTVNGKHGAGAVLRFFVSADHLWVRDIALDGNVSVVYADVDQAQFVSITGTARVVRNPSLQEALWTPWAQQNFPGGPLDPMLRILEVAMALAVMQNGRVRHELTADDIGTPSSRESSPLRRRLRPPRTGQGPARKAPLRNAQPRNADPL